MVTIRSARATHRLIITDIKNKKHKMVSFISDKSLEEIYNTFRKKAEEL